jgi:hypothetical protein
LLVSEAFLLKLAHSRKANLIRRRQGKRGQESKGFNKTLALTHKMTKWQQGKRATKVHYTFKKGNT